MYGTDAAAPRHPPPHEGDVKTNYEMCAGRGRGEGRHS